MEKNRHRAAAARRKSRRTAPGAQPGVLRADPDAHTSQLQIISYDAQNFVEPTSPATETIEKARTAHAVTWINVVGLRDVDLIHEVGMQFNLHSLALEDVVNTHQRPKLEDYGDHIYIVLHMPTADGVGATEQLSLFVGADFVVTFQELPGDWFEPVRNRIHTETSRLRQRGPDFLAYALIDAVIDSYFPLMESLGEAVDQLEVEVMNDPRQNHVTEIHALRRDLLHLRRAIWPMRELLNGLLRDNHPVIHEHTQLFIRDCYDHTVQLMDMVDTSREMMGSLIDIHLTATNNRMNEIMKVLTIIATIFIPLGFIASLYGMNFDPAVSPWNMPELKWRFGYLFAVLVMLSIGCLLMFWFWRKGWIGTRNASRFGKRAPR